MGVPKKMDSSPSLRHLMGLLSMNMVVGLRPTGLEEAARWRLAHFQMLIVSPSLPVRSCSLSRVAWSFLEESSRRDRSSAKVRTWWSSLLPCRFWVPGSMTRLKRLPEIGQPVTSAILMRSVVGNEFGGGVLV